MSVYNKDLCDCKDFSKETIKYVYIGEKKRYLRILTYPNSITMSLLMLNTSDVLTKFSTSYDTFSSVVSFDRAFEFLKNNDFKEKDILCVHKNLLLTLEQLQDIHLFFKFNNNLGLGKYLKKLGFILEYAQVTASVKINDENNL